MMQRFKMLKGSTVDSILLGNGASSPFVPVSELLLIL